MSLSGAGHTGICPGCGCEIRSALFLHLGDAGPQREQGLIAPPAIEIGHGCTQPPTPVRLTYLGEVVEP